MAHASYESFIRIHKTVIRMSIQSRIKDKLKELEQNRRARSISYKNDPSDTTIVLDLSSNDYLGLSRDVRLRAPLKELSRVGTSASRVLGNSLQVHADFEYSIADFTGFEKSLLFGSGYLSNIGVLSSLIGRNDYVISDKLIHASLIDGINLSRGNHLRASHNSISHFEDRLKKVSTKRLSGSEVFLVTESVFSMDGDLAPLRDLYELARKYDATLIVDEAHAMGVYGDMGRGLFDEECKGLERENVIILGTLSKSFGSYGGFVCGSSDIIAYLISTARSFLFSTALPEALVHSSAIALSIFKSEQCLGKDVLRRAALFRRALEEEGINFDHQTSHILPIHVGEEGKTLKVAEELKKKGIKLSAIRPPTVPIGTSRLRCSITNVCAESQLLSAAKEIASSVRTHTLISK